MFKVFVNDGTQELPDDDIFYIVSKEGLFLKKKLGLLESIARVDKISILENLNELPVAKMNIPKVNFVFSKKEPKPKIYCCKCGLRVGGFMDRSKEYQEGHYCMGCHLNKLRTERENRIKDRIPT